MLSVSAAIRVLALGLALPVAAAHAQDFGPGSSGKLLLTGGVSQIEGAGGGGLSPWALIGGYGTRDQVGANAYYTRVRLDDYSLDSRGVMLGLYDRVEVSIAQQRFDTREVGAALGLGHGFTIGQDMFGLKVKLAGDAVLAQDTWLPQIALGVLHKRNGEGALLRGIGARGDSGTDVYLSATRLLLAQGLLLNATLRSTAANQFGLLGFGGDRHAGRSIEFEGSAAVLLDRHLALGVEYRGKPDNLHIAGEDAAWDAFLAWAPNKHVSLTLAYVDLGNIVIADHQRGWYASVQVGL